MNSTQQRQSDFLTAKIVLISLFITTMLIISGCGAMQETIRLRPQSLITPSNTYSEQIRTSAIAEGVPPIVGSITATACAIPVASVNLESDGNRKIMNFVRDALQQVGYRIIIVHSGLPSEIPVLTCRIKKFWFKDYTWLMPFIRTWGEIQLEVILLTPVGEVLWTRDFSAKNSTWNASDAFSNVANQSMKTILNEMVNEFAGEEFHNIVVKYYSESEAKKPAKSMDELQDELNKLDKMKSEGLLTEEEYIQLKKKIIDEY